MPVIQAAPSFYRGGDNRRRRFSRELTSHFAITT